MSTSKAKAKKTVARRKSAKKVPPPKSEVKTDGLKSMKPEDIDAFLDQLNKGNIKLFGAEDDIYQAAKAATEKHNETVQAIQRLTNQLENLKIQQIRLQGEQAGHLNLLIKIEDGRRSDNAKARSS